MPGTQVAIEGIYFDPYDRYQIGIRRYPQWLHASPHQYLRSLHPDTAGKKGNTRFFRIDESKILRPLPGPQDDLRANVPRSRDNRNMLTDLVQIRRLGDKKREENQRFRKHLKSHNFVEKKFRIIAQAIEDQIDCTVCANCCRVATVRLQERDIEKLAKFLRVNIQQFVRDYTAESADEGRILKRTEAGCVFLSGNDCIVYEARPATCTTFPNVVRGNGSIPSRMWEFVDRATYCPIVYNWMEAVKEETGFTAKP